MCSHSQHRKMLQMNLHQLREIALCHSVHQGGHVSRVIDSRAVLKTCEVIVTHTRAHPRHPQVRMECSHTHPSLVIEHVPERRGESFTKVRSPLQLR
ncbi:hypothetical protein C0Q70_17926 [Pomacea canaliculata]|uniref:Uncharacterized protein n=1 Tax=Pomacea canaliculata TaxID=400727 RepID=A0A2T7NLS8_POMCA|nr:hypothetical protein C0Q70_17926 [Pomacea canaliculata]